MASIPPPEGLNESDYEAIEAAVTETVRGRWFLAEFARRNRAGEMRQLLDAISRLESNVLAGQQAALPSADPSVRLLIQRIKEISAQLDGLVGDMRSAGIEERFVAAVGLQARAVSGMMRGGPAPKPLAAPAGDEASRGEAPRGEAPRGEASRGGASEAGAMRADVSKPAPRLPRAHLPPNMLSPLTRPAVPSAVDDPRLAVLSGLDGLSVAEKLALFS